MQIIFKRVVFTTIEQSKEYFPMATEFNRRNLAMTVHATGASRSRKRSRCSDDQARKCSEDLIAPTKSLLDQAMDTQLKEVDNKPVGSRRWCTEWRPKKYPPFFVLEGKEGVDYTFEDAHTRYHEWEDGVCKHCKLTLKEVTVKKVKKNNGKFPKEE